MKEHNMLLKNKACLVALGLSALSLHAQAAQSIILTDLNVVSSIGKSVSKTSKHTMVGVAAAPSLVTTTDPVVTSEVVTAATATTPGKLKTTTSYTRYTTPYSAVVIPTETVKSIVAQPSITGGVQRLKLSGTITSTIDQTMSFSLLATGSYTKFVDEDGDLQTPPNPIFKYKFSTLPIASLSGGTNPGIRTYDAASIPNHYSDSADLAPVTFTANEVMYFVAQISTVENSSIADFQMAFTGMPWGGQAETPTKTNVEEFSFTSIPATVPEPGTYAMLLSGLCVMGFIGRRNKRSAA